MRESSRLLPAPSSLPPPVCPPRSAEFRDFLKTALDKNPETRPSAAQLLEVSGPPSQVAARLDPEAGFILTLPWGRCAQPCSHSQRALGTHTRQPLCREGEGRPESCLHRTNLLGEGDRRPMSSTGEGLLSYKRRTRGAL